MNPSRLMGVINDAMDGTKVRIGKIDMDKTFTRIDVEERHAAKLPLDFRAKTGSYVINAYFEEGGQTSARSGRSSYGGGRRDDRGGRDRGGRGRRDSGNS